MTDIGNIRSFITADSTDFDRNLDKAGAKVDGFARRATKRFADVGKAMSNLGRTMSFAVTLPLAAASAGFIKLASDAEETQNKFNVVFSSITNDANQAAESLAESFGLAGDQSQKLLADTGDLLTGFGFTQRAALDMATEVNILAADLASFTNIEGGAERASRALTKALLGERESVKELGISILDADVKARVLMNTQQGLTFESVRQAKAFATLQLAQEQSKNAIGDFERSSSSFANQMRIVTADARDLAVAFGKQLLPPAQLLLGWAKDVAKAFGELSPQTQRLAIVIGAVAAAAGPLLFVAGKLMGVIAGLVGVFGLTISPLLLVASVVGLVGLAWIGTGDRIESFGKFFSEFGKWYTDENADISENSQENINLIAKAWVGLKFAFVGVRNFLVGAFATMNQKLFELQIVAIDVAEGVARAFGKDIPRSLKSYRTEMEIAILALGDLKKKNAKELDEIEVEWSNATEVLRRDLNAFAATMGAIPEAAIAGLDSMFPGFMEKLRSFMGKVNAFIETGDVGLVIPIRMGDAAALALAEFQLALDEAMAMGPQQDEGVDLMTLAGLGEGQMDAWLAQHLNNLEMANSQTAFQAAIIKQNLQDALMPDSAKIAAQWKGIASAYSSVFSQLSGLYKKGSAEQKVFAATSIVIDTAMAIMKVHATTPYPWSIPLMAAVAAIGAIQLAKVGGGGGGGSSAVSGAATSGDFSDQTSVSPGVDSSQVIGAPEAAELEAAPVTIEMVASGDELMAVITRGAVRGAGDGVNTLVFQGA